MKLTTARLKQLIKEQLEEATTPYSDTMDMKGKIEAIIANEIMKSLGSDKILGAEAAAIGEAAAQQISELMSQK